MRAAVFADVHANLEALQAFLKLAEEMEVERYFFLGDIVGYGANPNECVDILRSMTNVEAVMGNHDAAVLWKTSPYQMHTFAREAVFWTMDKLSKENIEFLGNLKYSIICGDTCYCHSTPQNPSAWNYLNTKGKAFMTFRRSPYKRMFVSHTHWPKLISEQKMWSILIEDVVSDKDFLLAENLRWIINCGSVGQPRDGICDGVFCLYDSNKQSVSFHRFDYNREKAKAKILKAGLPGYFAARLEKGR